MIGDVVTHVDPTGGVAEIGYTLAREHHGHGYASEAAAALAAVLFDEVGVGRVYGELAPENIASQRVLEAIGLRFEAVTKKSYLLARRMDRQHVVRGDEGRVRRVALAGHDAAGRRDAGSARHHQRTPRTRNSPRTTPRNGSSPR